MSYDLKVDYGRLREMSKQLAGISGKLGEVDGDSDFTEDDFGNGVLLEAVRTFADGWRDGRKEIVDGVKKMSETISEIADKYDELDQGFKDTGSGNGGSGNTGTGTGTGDQGSGSGGGSTQPGDGPSGGGGAGSGGGPAPSPGAPPADGGGSGLDIGLVPPIPGRPGPVDPDPIWPVPSPGAPPGAPSTPQSPAGRNRKAAEQIDARIADIDQELAWIEGRLDEHAPDTRELLDRRTALLEERGFLNDLRDLLHPDPAEGGGRMPFDPSGGMTVDPVLLNPTDPVGDGRLVVGLGDPAASDNVVVRITHEPGEIGRAISSGTLGSDSAWDLVRTAPATAGATAVVSWQELDGRGSGRGGAGVLAQLLLGAAPGASVTVVADTGTVGLARDAIGAGARVDHLVEVGSGPDRSVHAWNVGPADRTGGALGGALASGGPAELPAGGEGDDVLERLVKWVRDTLGGDE